jgi:hypothetical protein
MTMGKQDEKTTALPGDLAALQGAAAEVDAETAPPELTPDGQPVPVVDYFQEARKGVDIFAGLVCGYAPKAADIWTEEAKQRAAAGLMPVYEKYGVTMSALPCEVMAAIIVGPLLYASSKIVAAQMQIDQAAAKAKAQAKPESGAANAGDTPEQAVHSQMALYQ